MTKFQKKPKHPKAPWVGAFKGQAKALRPENAGQGVKSRSGGEKAKMAVYRAIKDIWLRYNVTCETGINAPNCQISPVEVHHRRGRSSLLLFDVRHWLAVCPACHAWIHAHPAEARAKGWLAKEGEWNREAE